jgi:hypothetical protein
LNIFFTLCDGVNNDQSYAGEEVKNSFHFSQDEATAKSTEIGKFYVSWLCSVIKAVESIPFTFV